MIDLGPVAEAEIVALVQAARPPRLDPARTSWIVATAEGNPFFALELARADDGTTAIPRTA